MFSSLQEMWLSCRYSTTWSSYEAVLQFGSCSFRT